MNGINGGEMGPNPMPEQGITHVTLEPVVDVHPGLVERAGRKVRAAIAGFGLATVAIGSLIGIARSETAPTPVEQIEQIVPGDHIPCAPEIPTTTTEEGCNPHKTTPESTTTTEASTTTTEDSTTTTSEATTTTSSTSTSTTAPSSTTTRPTPTTTEGPKETVPPVETTDVPTSELVTG